jgi:aminoglycoside phosphotransferase (APT) family kinase protein
MPPARLSRINLARLIEQLSPGGRLIRTRRLRGGIGARMDALLIKEADGTRRKVSLRRFVRDRDSSRPEHVAHEFEVLRLVRSAGIAAPEPLLLDAEGAHFGVPTMVLSYLPGQPLYLPDDERAWSEQLARALLTVHAVTPDRVDLSMLNVHLIDGMRMQLERRAEPARERGALAREVHAVLTTHLDRIEWPAPCLVHDDFWPGNTVWFRRRLTGIIDWTHAEVGDPRADVAQCRVDVAVSHSLGLADAFLEAYQQLTPQPLPDLWFFDLHRGLGALLHYEQWLEGYHDAGLTHLTRSAARRRLSRFVRRALAAKTR